MQKTTLHTPSTATLMYAAVAAKLRALMDKFVPVGYQDEAGFHQGTQRSGKVENWPHVD
jgi:hypothetical protein